MTVKELRTLLADYDDDMPVVVHATDGLQDWLTEINHVNGQEVRKMAKHLAGCYVERVVADYAERMPGPHRDDVKCDPAVTAALLS